MLSRFRILLLALVAFAAATAPTAAATPPISDTLEFPELEIFDLHATTACGGTWVFANLTGTFERRVYFKGSGEISHQVETFRGKITWFTRGTGKSYTSAIVNKSVIEFPEGVDLGKPTRITVTGLHGGVFPIGGGPAGSGTLVYDGFVVAQDDEGFVYTFAEGDPISMRGNFETTNRRICEAVA